MFVCDSWLALKRGSSNRRRIRSVYDAAPAGEKTNRKETERRDEQKKQHHVREGEVKEPSLCHAEKQAFGKR